MRISGRQFLRLALGGFAVGLLAGCTDARRGGDGADAATPLDGRADTLAIVGAAVAKTSLHARTHYRVVTPTATYLLDSASGGLSSMIDREGNDWIAFRPEPWGRYPASAASAYRGIPNLVFRGPFDGAGHPGHDGVVSDVVGARQIRCHTPGGPWAWTWTFEPEYARLDVTGVSDTSAYWFLYEGPPAGRYDPALTYYATDETTPAFAQFDHLDHYRGREEVARRDWYYFGRDGVERTLEMIHLTPDEIVDHYSLLGNDTVGIASADGMIVAGFGRAPGATPALTEPNSFAIRFTEGDGSGPEAYARKSAAIRAFVGRVQ